ncbi:hypothetical protein [Psychrobacter sp. Ps3]|uniref:hypothetical protein n=1 Tax=Psychrobacter sp. Ps3 TaxID=2790957 RepID=UPI001EDF8B8C|nr:hypothetical protein [Psychrobacter sp. Ps3]MCG3882589.1 hypothetical protein [Psychrobacter sp. Ps3]
MTNNNPFNLIPLIPTGRNEKDNVNLYSPDDMITIYEQQFLTEVPDDKLTEFLPALKAFYDIDDNSLDISAVIFDAIGDAAIIYNHKIKVGDYQLLSELVKESANDDIYNAQAFTIDCLRTFYINDIKIPYHFNLFIQGDGYSTLTEKNTVLEKLYWFVHDGFDEHLLGNPDDVISLESINAELNKLGIREMDLTTVHAVVNYIEDHIIDDAMADALNEKIDAAE